MHEVLFTQRRSEFVSGSEAFSRGLEGEGVYAKATWVNWRGAPRTSSKDVILSSSQSVAIGVLSMMSLRVGAEWRRVQGCVALADSPIPKTHLCNRNAPHPVGNTQVGSLYMAFLRRGHQERNELAFATH